MLGSPLNKLRAQHDGAEGLAINNTLIRRFSTRLALATISRFYSRNGVCVPISTRKIVKAGPTVHLTEAATIQYIAKNTSIPVPKIYCSFIRGDRAYIVMERIHGNTIAKSWKTLSTESLERVFAQLKDIMRELRELPPPGARVESQTGGSLRDSRIPRAFPRFGPFKTVQEFHLWLRDGFQLSETNDSISDKEHEELENMVSMHDGPWPAPVFTHGDLNPANILIRGDKVVGILDWEFSGWYPNYWEYTSAWCGNVTTTEWQGQLDRFLDGYPEELEMEKIRQKWWGE